jgi:hypothetical protein
MHVVRDGTRGWAAASVERQIASKRAQVRYMALPTSTVHAERVWHLSALPLSNNRSSGFQKYE